jgi:serine/threonine protein kinase
VIGRVFSHYQILERLGGGGMGVVYKARDLKLDRLVALKFFSPRHEEGDEPRRRFRREAQAASALDHPNICALYEIGDDEGRPFLAMAYCEGETLKRRLARGPLPWPEAVDLAAQIAAGLAAAHARGIVHRDVKPANVLVAPPGRVKIVDFGIASLAGEARITRAGTTLGTAAYMAPEQLRGEAVDARTDVWSLGVVLYEMLAGRPPFRGPGEQQLADAILAGDPEPLAVTGVPEGLEQIVLRALARAPAKRFQSAAEMRSALLAVRAVAPVADPEETLLDVPAADPAEQRTETRGTTASHYRLLDLLGGGAMGLVYRAEDVRLQRTVALKFLPPELTRDPRAKERFLREARAASALDHANLCTVYEVGETAEGQLYLAMPCYDGETLEARLGRGPLPVEAAVDVAWQIAKGLAKAHRHGIVHRDLKPANLFLTDDNVVKILDFGIAKLAGGATLTGAQPLGTPAYMAPEQARGGEVDGRADVWALGAILY